MTIGSRIRTGAATTNGHEIVLGTVMMLIGENSHTVAKRVADALPDIRKALPKGMTLTVQYSRADLVDETISTVEKNLSEGAILVCARTAVRAWQLARGAARGGRHPDRLPVRRSAACASAACRAI